MQFDVVADAPAAKSALTSSLCPPARGLRKSIQRGPVAVISRALEPEVLTALDAVPADRLPRLRLVGGVEHLRRLIDKGLAEVGFGPSWLAGWLLEDVTSLARFFNELTKTDQMRLRLEAVGDDACRKFHVDNVRFRLVTTYRGPGTEWIPPDALATFPKGAAVPLGCVRQLDRGDVAVIRGARESSAERPGLLHRSPPIAGSGVTRLFLAIDDGADAVAC